MLLKSIRRLMADESGANVIEYAVLSCLMAVVIVVFAASGLSVPAALASIGIVLEDPGALARAFDVGRD